MECKHYEKPTMQVVKLQHQAHLLAGSNGGSMPGGVPAEPFSRLDEQTIIYEY